MSNLNQQIVWVQRALSYTKPIPFDELLIPLDRNGMLVRKMKPDRGITPREAAVLVLLYPKNNELYIPLTIRSASLPQHSGEVSLPGGAADPEDGTPLTTALRETHEELGIPPEKIHVWGSLTTIYIPPSNFHLTPIVGFMPTTPMFRPCQTEIAEMFDVSLQHLMDPNTVVVEERVINGVPVQIPFYALHGKVWGATALVLSELIARIRKVQESDTYPLPKSRDH